MDDYGRWQGVGRYAGVVPRVLTARLAYMEFTHAPAIV